MIKTSNLVKKLNLSSKAKLSNFIKLENNKNTKFDTIEGRNRFLPNNLLITKSSNLVVSFNRIYCTLIRIMQTSLIIISFRKWI